MKPYSEASARNAAPILQVLQATLPASGALLEVGSGTGQHAAAFAAALPAWRWQASDRTENLPSIAQWITEAALPNLPAALPLDVTGDWPDTQVDAIFSANTCHIMSWYAVECLLRGAGQRLHSGGHLLVYGPFCDDGRHNSDSNLNFDRMLRQRDPLSGLRDIRALRQQAALHNLRWIGQQALPANNRCLIWQKI